MFRFQESQTLCLYPTPQKPKDEFPWGKENKDNEMPVKHTTYPSVLFDYSQGVTLTLCVIRSRMSLVKWNNPS